MDVAKLLEIAWAAFPCGWCQEPGSRTRCGATLVRVPTGDLWVLPPALGGSQGARLAPVNMSAGDADVRNLRDGLQLLPDMSDPATVYLIRDLLARRAGLDTSRGVHWTPRANGKTHGGWTISTPTRSKYLPAALVPSRDAEVAILQGIMVTNCTCYDPNKGGRSKCPQHGAETPWR